MKVKTDTGTHQLLSPPELIANSNIRDGFGYRIWYRDGEEERAISEQELMYYVILCLSKLNINPSLEPAIILLKIKNKTDYCIFSMDRTGTMSEIYELTLKVEYITTAMSPL